MIPTGKKLIKRKPKGGAAPDEFYFNAGTQQAIVDYKAETNSTKRNDIYVKDILPAFSKLVENLINVYGFQIQYESKADLQNECIEVHTHSNELEVSFPIYEFHHILSFQAQDKTVQKMSDS